MVLKWVTHYNPVFQSLVHAFLKLSFSMERRICWHDWQASWMVESRDGWIAGLFYDIYLQSCSEMDWQGNNRIELYLFNEKSFPFGFWLLSLALSLFFQYFTHIQYIQSDQLRYLFWYTQYSTLQKSVKP